VTEFVHECHVGDARKFWDWIKSRGGVAVWRSVNLGNPGASWSTPVKTLSGEDFSKPTWQVDNSPSMTVTDPDVIKVFDAREVARVKLAIRTRGSSLVQKPTPASNRRVLKALKDAGDDAYHVYDGDEALIMKPCGEMSLRAWAEKNGL
jgi:hypothetical protein